MSTATVIYFSKFARKITHRREKSAGEPQEGSQGFPDSRIVGLLF
jgi:hypothetical protein